MGHKKGKRKREKECVEKALDVDHKKHCIICGLKLTRISPDDPSNRKIFDALESGKCPLCGCGLKVTDEGVLFCASRPVCNWCVYIPDLRRR